MKLIDEFISNFESAFGIKTQKASITEEWAKQPPPEAAKASVEEFLSDVGVKTFCYAVYHSLGRFPDDYRATFHKEPYVNPVTRWRWNIARTVSKTEHNDAMERLEVYREWLLREMLQAGKRNTLLILPITSQEVDFREDPPGPPTAPKAFDGIWLAPILGAPEISIPIGELEFHSRISGLDEYLPVVVSLLGPPGSDMALIHTARRVLENSGRPTSVKTGSRMFTTREGTSKDLVTAPSLKDMKHDSLGTDEQVPAGSER